MLGFPTETREEIEATIDYAVKSRLSQAYFFDVVPQPGTPLYDLALQESPTALEGQTLQEYNSTTSFYGLAYGVNMQAVKKWAYIRFFVLSPKRWVRLIRMMPWKNFATEFRDFLTLFLFKNRVESDPLPEELQPLSHLYAADEEALTSAQTQRKSREPRLARSVS